MAMWQVQETVGASNVKFARLEQDQTTASAAKAEQDAKMAALRTLQKLLNRPDALQVFQKFDTDHSGTVDRDELRMGVRAAPNHARLRFTYESSQFEHDLTSRTMHG